MFNMTESSIRLFLFWGGLLFFLGLELLVPYRQSSVSKLKRWVNNLALVLFNSILLILIFLAAIVGTATYVQTHNLGILNLVQAPGWLKLLVSDLNMDVFTATRFHIGELAISAVIKISLIFFLGATLLGVLIFESALVWCAQFEHSSLRVPKWFETIFWVLCVPPSMHRIHHSVIIQEKNTNYGTIFSLWDRCLGTLLKNVDQNAIRIGVGAYRNPDVLNIHRLLVMPFTKAIR